MISNTKSVFSGPEVVKLFSCSTQLGMKFFLLINFTFMRGKNSILGLPEPKKPNFLIFLSSLQVYLDYPYKHLKFHAQLNSILKVV